jgi:hypothetical protein
MAAITGVLKRPACRPCGTLEGSSSYSYRLEGAASSPSTYTSAAGAQQGYSWGSYAPCRSPNPRPTAVAASWLETTGPIGDCGWKLRFTLETGLSGNKPGGARSAAAYRRDPWCCRSELVYVKRS